MVNVRQKLFHGVGINAGEDPEVNFPKIAENLTEWWPIVKFLCPTARNRRFHFVIHVALEISPTSSENFGHDLAGREIGRRYRLINTNLIKDESERENVNL
jgi:hypothetical protein